MAEVQLEKKIKVLIAASGRIQKEYLAYKNEIVQLQDQLGNIEDIEENALKIKKQTELLNESKSMLPNAFSRLEENNDKLIELQNQLGNQNAELNLLAQECILITKEFLNQVNPALN